MPVIRFTDLVISKLSTAEATAVYMDASTPGFGVRVGKTGKTFIAIVGARERRKVSIGKYPDISLQEARRQAKRLMLEPSDKPSETTWVEAVQRYHEAYLLPNYRERQAKEAKRQIDKGCAQFGCRAVGTISSGDLSRIFDAMADRPSAANHLYGVLKTFFNWCERRDYVARSPLAKLSRPYRSTARARVLSDDELQRIWHGVDPASTFGTIIRLCILTGQRRGEIAQATSGWIGEQAGGHYQLVIPADVAKNGVEHHLPISIGVAGLISQLPGVYSGWSQAKRRLDRRCGMGDWTIHDLRRTFATLHGRLGTAVHITERLLNHVSGTHAGIVGVYQRFEYLTECRAAMEKYEAFILKLVGQEETRSTLQGRAGIPKSDGMEV